MSDQYRTDHPRDAPAGDPLEIAMARIAAVGWRDFDPSREPATASVFSTKRAVLDALVRRVEDEVRAGVDDDARSPAYPTRERLLEVLMLRFDAMRPYKPGIAVLLRALPFDPLTALGGLPALRAAMRETLRHVGVDADGLCGEARAKGLAAVFLAGLRVWVDEDSADLSATMRELDRRLRTAEEWATGLGLAREQKHPGG